MPSPEPEDFAQVTVVPYRYVSLLAGQAADVETVEVWVARDPIKGHMTVHAERGNKKIEFTVQRHAFVEFLNRLADLCQ